MKKLLMLFAVLPILSYGQIVGSSVFLQGTYLEIALNAVGSFGVPYSTIPSGYHPSSVMYGLAESYDYGHDGWTTGSPTYFADYTYYGSPYEAWYIQVDSGTSYSYGSTSGTGGPSTSGLTHGSYSYSNYGGTTVAEKVDTNTAGNLQIKTQTQVDYFASWVVVNVTLTNISSSGLHKVYYARFCDPDNNNNFNSTNTIVYQNSGADKCLITATASDASGLYPFLGLGTKDRRARAFTSGFPLPSSTDFASVYAHTASGYGWGAGHSSGGDIGMGMIYKIDTIAPGDSAHFAFAYIFNDTSGLEAAFPSLTYGSRQDSFAVAVTRLCSGPRLTDYTDHYFVGSLIKTYWGDGSWDTGTVVTGYGRGTKSFMHTYGLSGSYTIRQVLYYGATPMDSLHFTYNHVRCTAIPVDFYIAADTNCVKDSSEASLSSSITVEVDSNGVAVDTISCMSSFYYEAQGIPGDIYQFRVLQYPTGYSAVCPSSGVLSDTISTSIFCRPVQHFGLGCSTLGHDLSIHAVISVTGINDQVANVYLKNESCVPVNADVSVHYSPQYAGGAYPVIPTPVTAAGDSITWSIAGMRASAGWVHLYYAVWSGGIHLPIGDTVQSTFIVNPKTGDNDTSDNIEIIIDTVRAGCDPNAIWVRPAGCIASGLVPNELKYIINFENTGNDTAFNIHVLDTLPDNVDISTLKMIMSSHEMYITKLKDAGHNILKFDFPNINLLDSSHHGLCDGALIFTVKTKAGLIDGTDIMNRVGIYFDINDVVMTNEAHNVIGCPIVGVNSLGSSYEGVTVYPNPTFDLLNIKADDKVYDTYTITNGVGIVIATGALVEQHTKVNIKHFPAGVYFLNLKGARGNVVKRVVKM